MIDDGFFKCFFKFDYVFVLYIGLGLYGLIVFNSGLIMFNFDGLEIMFKGCGGYGFVFDKIIDLVMMVVCFVVDL